MHKLRHTFYITIPFFAVSLLALNNNTTACMKIKSLENTPIETIVATLSQAFAGYFVPMPATTAYWEKRFYMARVDYGLSFGLFDGDRLAGFIIHGIDCINGQLTAYNTATGVIPQYRNARVIDQLYTTALPFLRNIGVKCCTLEVITQNARAIHVYERIGFQRSAFLRSFKGQLTASGMPPLCKQVPFPLHHPVMKNQEHLYSWDFKNKALLLGSDTYTCFEVAHKQQPIGYYAVNKQSGQIARMDTYNETQPIHWNYLLEGIAHTTPSVKLVNVSEQRDKLMNVLVAAGLENFINQYEMKMSLQ